MTGIHAKHYKNRHKRQGALRNSAITRRQGCTWTTGANGIDAATGGSNRPSPDTVLHKVAQREQTSPMTPGWSLEDLQLACKRLGVKLDIREGWDELRIARNTGFYIALQGDSDVFDVGCSSDFDGLHCIGIHPDESDGRWRMDDPLCPTATHREQAKLREYAQKLADEVFGGTIRFGVFMPAVPLKRK